MDFVICNQAMTLVKYFTRILEQNIMMCFMAASAGTEKMTDMEIMLELGMSRASFTGRKKQLSGIWDIIF